MENSANIHFWYPTLLLKNNFCPQYLFVTIIIPCLTMATGYLIICTVCLIFHHTWKL